MAKPTKHTIYVCALAEDKQGNLITLPGWKYEEDEKTTLDSKLYISNKTIIPLLNHPVLCDSWTINLRTTKEEDEVDISKR